MMDRADDVAEGVAAWGRLRRAERTSWEDWTKVGAALAVGRTTAMKIANTNRAVGTRYNLAMGKWLADHGLADIAAQERYRLRLILENMDAISAWRAGLDDASRRKFNHPNSVWAHWKRSAVRPHQHVVRTVAPSPIPHLARGKPVFWPGDAIGRAAQAIRDAWPCTDTHKLARKCLEAAVPTDAVLMALLQSASSAKPPARSAPEGINENALAF